MFQYYQTKKLIYFFLFDHVTSPTAQHEQHSKISEHCACFEAEEFGLIFKELSKGFFNCRNWPTFLIVNISDRTNIFCHSHNTVCEVLLQRLNFISQIMCLMGAWHSNLVPEALRLLQLLISNWTIFSEVLGITYNQLT